MHAAELDQAERPPGQPHALLDEEHGTPGVELDEEPDQAKDGRQDDQADHRHEEAQRSRERALETGRSEGAGEDDTARRDRLEGQLPSQALIRLGDVFDEDSARPRLDESGERQSPPALGQADHDAIGPGRFDDAPEVLGLIHHPDDGVSKRRPPLDLLDDAARQCAPPEDEHTLADASQAPGAARHAHTEEEAEADDEETRRERRPAMRRLGDKAVDDAHRIHAASILSRLIRTAARSHRIGPSLSAACRTTGPGSRSSARTITGGSPSHTPVGSTGLAPSVV